MFVKNELLCGSLATTQNSVFFPPLCICCSWLKKKIIIIDGALSREVVKACPRAHSIAVLLVS